MAQHDGSGTVARVERNRRPTPVDADERAIRQCERLRAHGVADPNRVKRLEGGGMDAERARAVGDRVTALEHPHREAAVGEQAREQDAVAAAAHDGDVDGALTHGAAHGESRAARAPDSGGRSSRAEGRGAIRGACAIDGC